MHTSKPLPNGKAQVLLQQAADSLQQNIKNALTLVMHRALKDVFHDKQVSFGVEFIPQKHTTCRGNVHRGRWYPV